MEILNKLKLIKAISKQSLKGLFQSARFDYATPQHIFDELNKEFHFTLDPCALPENAKCNSYFTPEIDGLKQKWFGNVFMNPPYGRQIGKWLKKASDESKNCNVIVCLIPSRTDTKWWHDYVMKADEIRFVKGRIKFDGKNSAPFPSCIAVFRRNVHA